MSRTIRRKSETWEFKELDYWWMYPKYSNTEVEDYFDNLRKRSQIRYHKDMWDSMRQVPSWFRRAHNRIRRSKHKQKLLKCLKTVSIVTDPICGETFCDIDFDPGVKEHKTIIYEWW